jgi:hypothetical protein
VSTAVDWISVMEVVQAAVNRNGGVVDPGIDPTEAGDRGACDLFGRTRARDVDRNGDDLAPAGA